MLEDFRDIKKQIKILEKEIEQFSDQNEITRNKLSEEYESLSYRYYKYAVSKMRNMQGHGDGI